MTAISALAADGERIELTEADISGFWNALRGPLFTNGQDGYEAARRVWNGNVDRRSAVIARCASVADAAGSHLRPCASTAGLRARRRSRGVGLRHQRRRARHRSVGDEGHPGGPPDPHGQAACGGPFGSRARPENPG